MIPSLRLAHPSLQQLSEFAKDELLGDSRRGTAAHLQSCTHCQNALRFLHRLDAAATLAGDRPSDQLLERILGSRAAGERFILPAADTAELTPTSSRLRWRHAMPLWGVAAGAIFIFALAHAIAPTAVRAAAERSVLIASPRSPHMGQSVSVRYVPGSGRLGRVSTLQLRARLRARDDQAYSVPATQVRAVGTLQRMRDGSFEGRLALPDSVVFAVLSVEDSSALFVDDNAGQGWELIAAGTDGRPLFAALYQRTNDMMGRSWEQGFDAIRTATALYPDSVHGWTYRQLFESELFHGEAGDSVRKARDQTIAALVARAKRAPALSYAEMGSIYFRAWAHASQTDATRGDSVEADYWWTRMLREYPRHEQAAQRLALSLDVHRLGPIRSLDSLDTLYLRFQPLGLGPGGNLAQRGVELATKFGDVFRLRRWMERARVGSPDSVYEMATYLSTHATTRDSAMATLRRLLTTDSSVRTMLSRPLGRTAAAQQLVIEDRRRMILGTLGRALIAQGRSREALDTLRLAASGGWDAGLNRELARSYALVGDTIGTVGSLARLTVDGRTGDEERDSLVRVGTHQIGRTRWESMLEAAKREMYVRLVERSISRSVPSTASVQSRIGRKRSLASVTNGKAALVIFWSRNCGYALEALPAVREMIARATAATVPVVFVLDEPPSAGLDRELIDRRITWPVYYDRGTSFRDALRNFDTPHLYVLDPAGRVRFETTDPTTDLISRVKAITSLADSAKP